MNASENHGDMQINQAPIDSLIPYANNARTHDDAQIAAIAASIKEFGFTNPILTDGAHGVIAGHGRLLAARQLGMAEVPTIELSGLSDAQKRAYILADNRIALSAGWDAELLAFELDELRDMNFDLNLLGFEAQELNDLIGTPIAPTQFAEVDENIETEFQCPKCKYVWSGKQK